MSSRSSIPLAVQRELWARSAGRCEFRGCNRLLYRDELTKEKSNLANMSHIVAARPGGPRGDAVRSPELQKDIGNLMLTCRDHAKVIDDKKLVDRYPEELLQEFKRDHEERIRRVTDLQADMATHMLLFQAPIGGRRTTIDSSSAYQAIRPRYPAEEQPLLIDLNGGHPPEDTEGFWKFMARSLKHEMQVALRPRLQTPSLRHASVFALAPIPLLAYFGFLLGDTLTAALYQRHRRTEAWEWMEVEEQAEPFYEVHAPECEDDNAKPVALLLSVSGRVDRSKVSAALGGEPVCYEIKARDPGLDFLRSQKRLEVFGYEFRKLMSRMRGKHGHDQLVHVFPAVPAPVAVECGRRLLLKCDLGLRFYGFVAARNGYAPALLIGGNVSEEVAA